uniref:Uncharacterized protein n=1 Tax=viral metagenome TaxID=1070528 RepID=A0A6C0JGW3_9ZZZZ
MNPNKKNIDILFFCKKAENNNTDPKTTNNNPSKKDSTTMVNFVVLYMVLFVHAKPCLQ